jgi:hypothetical protein
MPSLSSPLREEGRVRWHLSSFRHSGESRNPGLPLGPSLPMLTLSIEISSGRGAHSISRLSGTWAIPHYH